MSVAHPALVTAAIVFQHGEFSAPQEEWEMGLDKAKKGKQE